MVWDEMFPPAQERNRCRARPKQAKQTKQTQHNRLGRWVKNILNTSRSLRKELKLCFDSDRERWEIETLVSDIRSSSYSISHYGDPQRKPILMVTKSAQQINSEPYKHRLGVGAVRHRCINKTGFCYMSGEDFRKNQVLLLRRWWWRRCTESLWSRRKIRIQIKLILDYRFR